MTKLQIKSYVSESDIGSVQVGDDASITFSALRSATGGNTSAGTTLQGTVTQVDPTSTVSSNVVQYGVTMTINDPPANLRLGQTGNATITTASKDNVVAVPTAAITAVGPLKTVTVKEGTSRKTVTVETGLVGGNLTEIVSGVDAGDVLFLPSSTTGAGATSGGIPGAPIGGPVGGLGGGK
jgi:multidrug efflux pump subunit AcrA (membrane-fusion protein)